MITFVLTLLSGFFVIAGTIILLWALKRWIETRDWDKKSK